MLEDIGIGKEFLNSNSNAQDKAAKNYQMGLYQIKNLRYTKELSSTMERQRTKWGSVLVSSNKELMSRVYKELKNIKPSKG